MRIAFPERYGFNMKKAVFIFFMVIAGILSFTIMSSEEKASAAGSTIEENGIKIHMSYTRQEGCAIVSYEVTGEKEIVSVKYLKGSYKRTTNSRWDEAKNIIKKNSFKTTTSGVYSLMAEDSEGRRTICRLRVNVEFRAVWIAYYDFSDSAGMNEPDFTAYVQEMFDNAKNAGMNAVIVHVRPYGDAMYDSSYFPWSRYASGTQGVNPGYDPLKIMTEEAHARELEIHAWINPYRVTASTTDVSYLSKDNQARIWLTNNKTSDDRNVLAFGKQLYYNPARSAVRKLIISGIKEIVSNYDVDGIHFDDYFYPDWLGDWPNVGNYEKVFDGREYESYVKKCKKAGASYMDIVNWRRNNVNMLVKEAYSAIKEINPDVVFGISPGGFLDYLLAENRYYVDFPTWMSVEGYVDYICPQLYWSFETKNLYPYDTTLKRWLEYKKLDTVQVYVGLPLYKCTVANTVNKNPNSNPENRVDSAFENTKILAKMIKYARKTGQVDGYVIFDYADMVNKANAANMKAVKKLW